MNFLLISIQCCSYSYNCQRRTWWLTNGNLQQWRRWFEKQHSALLLHQLSNARISWIVFILFLRLDLLILRYQCCSPTPSSWSSPPPSSTRPPSPSCSSAGHPGSAWHSTWGITISLMSLFSTVSYFSKLLTMIGKGKDIVRAPLTAVMLPTSFPSPEIGKISPYLSEIQY